MCPGLTKVLDSDHGCLLPHGRRFLILSLIKNASELSFLVSFLSVTPEEWPEDEFWWPFCLIFSETTVFSLYFHIEIHDFRCAPCAVFLCIFFVFSFKIRKSCSAPCVTLFVFSLCFVMGRLWAGAFRDGRLGGLELVRKGQKWAG